MRKLPWVVALPLCCAGLLMADPGIQASDPGPIARPEGEHGVRLEKSRMAPMRDGVRLAADLYFPDVADEKLPTVLIRTPYDKNRMRDDKDGDTHMFASHGFVVVAQDSRGKFESEGIFSPPAGKEAEDGYDTVGWIAAQSWSNGKIGMHGCSYPAEVQAATAPLKHPNLTTMIPRNGPMIGAANGRYRYWSGFKGGVLDFAAALPWYFETGVKYSFKPPAGLPEEELAKIREFYDPTPTRLAEPDWKKLVWTLPLVDIMNKAGALPNDFRELITRDFGDPWWHDTMGYYDGTETISAPALHVSSWYDVSVDETIFEFNYFRENATTKAARNGQFLMLAPSTHCRYEEATQKTRVGDRDIGDARLDYYSIYLAWFDYWLKGIDNGVLDGPRVRYYTMGRNEWRSADGWPLPEVQYTNYYLHSSGNANSRYGDGRLSTEPPGEEPADTFVYDPAHPVPSTGGPRGTDWGTKAGAVDQGQVEVRDDVLVYTTAPLESGIELTGPITAILYVSSSAKDTDFTAKLVDVYPDGTAYNIQDSILRARYREGFTRKVWMERGGVYELRIDLDATSNYFAAGHRIRLQISSSDFPLYERNLNTGGNNFDEVDWVVAENGIHHSAEYPSHLILPVIPGGD